MVFCAALAGCRSNTQLGSQVQNTGNSSVVLAMTDTPPSNVSILSAKVTLTGATLTPGNVTLFSGSTTVELTRLQTDIAYLATATNMPAGNFTSVTLTFANPVLTIENDTASVIVSGTTTCNVGAICTIAPTTVANLSTKVPLTSFTISSGNNAGLLIDVNLDNLLSSALAADFSAGTTATSFIPAGTGAPLVGAEDVIGQVSSISTSAGTFTLTNATGSYTLKVDNTSTFFQFSCGTPGISCLQNGQIVSVDVGIQSDGTLLGRNIVFEDADSSDTEVEGMVVSTNLGSQQFNIVTLSESATVSGLNIGDVATVQYSISPATPFDIDLVHADNVQISTSGYSFAPLTTPTDLAVGQQVSIRRNTSSSGTSLHADRVRLRSTRVAGSVGSVGSFTFFMASLPFIITGHGFSTIQVQDSSSLAILSNETGETIPFSQIANNLDIASRGPMFNVGGQLTQVASKIELKP